MRTKCEIVVFSDKAYNGIIRESFAKHPVETGGILLGHILDNGVWIVMDMVPPGLNCVHEIALFEYDQRFVNYLGTSIANQYQKPLQVLGLWHRHPSSMDYFSSTDDVTNSDFASRNPYGVISGLVNIDPNLRLTMYHLDHTEGVRPQHVAYTKVPIEIGDDLIPEEYFVWRYVNAERNNLNPIAPSVSNSQVQKSNAKHFSQLSKNVNSTENTIETLSLDIPKKVESLISRQQSNSHQYKTIIIAMVCFFVGSLGGYTFAWKMVNPKPPLTPQQIVKQQDPSKRDITEKSSPTSRNDKSKTEQ